MLAFVAPTFDKSYTWLSLILCGLLILTPTDHRMAFLTFLAGAGTGLLPRTMGHHPRMLDILHLPETAILRSTGAWHGRGRFLARRAGAENGLGKIWLLEASAG